MVFIIVSIMARLYFNGFHLFCYNVVDYTDGIYVDAVRYRFIQVINNASEDDKLNLKNLH